MSVLDPDEFDPLADPDPIPPPSPPPPTPPAGAEMFSENAGAWALPDTDADPDEEPPEPEGHALGKEVADWLGNKEYFHGALPPDIAAIWGHPPVRVEDEATARILIGVWGTEEFRGSALHQAALADRAHLLSGAEVQARFKAERERGKKR